MRFHPLIKNHKFSSPYLKIKKNRKIFLRTFSTKSYGYKIGKKMGPQRFSTSSDLDKIFKGKYKILNKEVITRTINNQKNLISEWIVEAVKNV